MTIVKIDRSSIRINPRAGATVTRLRGPKTVSFDFPGIGLIPPHLVGRVAITQWQNAAKPEEGHHQSGIILDPEDALLFQDVPGIVISIEENLQIMHHRPEPKYLFSYDYPVIHCGSCGKDVKVNQIGAEEVWDGREERFIDQICPYCGAHYSFGEIKYESIEEALGGDLE